MQQLTGVCIVTSTVKRLRDFYSLVLQRDPEEDGEEYVAFSTGSQVILSLYSANAMANWAPDLDFDCPAARCVLEFEVGDPDAEYQRLLALDAQIVCPPTTYPWGLRAVWFNDPDGNLITFHSLVK